MELLESVGYKVLRTLEKDGVEANRVFQVFVYNVLPLVESAWIAGWLSVRFVGFLVGWYWTVSLGSVVGWRFARSLRFQVGWHFAVSLDFLVG